MRVTSKFRQGLIRFLTVSGLAFLGFFGLGLIKFFQYGGEHLIRLGYITIVSVIASLSCGALAMIYLITFQKEK